MKTPPQDSVAIKQKEVELSKCNTQSLTYSFKF